MKNFVLAALLILAAAFSRMIPHPPNFTPLAAMALAGGVYLNKRFALLVPVAALLLSDFVIGFHNTIAYVYGSFVLMGLIGLWLRSNKRVWTIFGASLAASVLFFVITNFGVWMSGIGVYYPKTSAGLMECYAAAIPFFRNTVLGDLVYTGVLFGLFELAAKFVGTSTTPVTAPGEK